MSSNKTFNALNCNYNSLNYNQGKSTKLIYQESKSFDISNVPNRRKGK